MILALDHWDGLGQGSQSCVSFVNVNHSASYTTNNDITMKLSTPPSAFSALSVALEALEVLEAKESFESFKLKRFLKALLYLTFRFLILSLVLILVVLVPLQVALDVKFLPCRLHTRARASVTIISRVGD